MEDAQHQASSLRVHVGMRDPLGRPGGLNNYIRGLAAGQRLLGHDVLVLDRVTQSGEYRIAEGACDLPDLNTEPEYAVHLHFAQTALPMLRRNSAIRAASSRLLHFHGPWFAEGRVQGNGFSRVAAKWLTELAVYHSRRLRYVAASSAFRDVLHSSFGIRKQLIHVVHPGVDSDRFTPGEMTIARNSLGLPTDGPLIAMVRRLEPRMGFDIAIRALADIPDAHLAICGTGSLDASLRSLVSDLKLEQRVTFLGRVPDELLPAAYQAADLTLVPTTALEGFGLVVLESFACGTPVISTKNGGLVEAQGPFAAEWTVRTGDIEAIASLVRTSLAQTLKEERTARRSYALSRSLKGMASQVEDLIV